MYSPHLYSSLVNVHIDDLRRSRSASRRHGTHSLLSSSDRGSQRSSSTRSAHPVRALAARFAH